MLRKPRLAAKLIGLYSTYLFTKRNRVRLLDIAITKACQYSCPHCYPDEFYDSEKKPLTVDEIVDAVKQGQAMGMVQFNFQGGEPTLNLDRLESLVSRCDPWGHYISLSSNAYRHKKEDLKKIFDMGIDKLALSLHSGIPAEHDAFVGSEGAYDKVMECIANSRKVGLETSLAIVITRDNVRSEGVTKVIDLCIRDNLLLDINVAMPVGKWSGKEQYVLDEEDYLYLDELNCRYPNIRRDIHPHLFRKGCLAAKELVYINVYGEVLTCPFLHFSLGNIREQKLKDMHAKALTNKWFSEHYPKCLACEDEEFFDKYMSKIFECKNPPVEWDKVFSEDKQAK
jgi:MoaA/NifB/PqqE/SkfB family radical SAM enzyme